jgi:hypothetical protein
MVQVKQTRVKAIERPYPRVNPDTTEIEKVYLPEPELIEEPQIDFAALMRMPVFVQEPGSPLSPSIEEEMMNFSLEVVPAIPGTLPSRSNGILRSINEILMQFPNFR